MSTRTILISAYAGLLVGLVLILAGLIWVHVRRQRMPRRPRTICSACRELTPAADLTNNVCWVCQRNTAALIVLGLDAPAEEVTVPAWLEAAVNAAAARS